MDELPVACSVARRRWFKVGFGLDLDKLERGRFVRVDLDDFSAVPVLGGSDVCQRDGVEWW